MFPTVSIGTLTKLHVVGVILPSGVHVRGATTVSTFAAACAYTSGLETVAGDM